MVASQLFAKSSLDNDTLRAYFSEEPIPGGRFFFSKTSVARSRSLGRLPFLAYAILFCLTGGMFGAMEQ